jgi:ABC-type uncharacterized transport system ATPase component
MQNEEVVDGEFTEVEETVAQPDEAIKCGIKVLITEGGNIYFDVEGSEQNLLIIDGLLKHAERQVERLWEARSNS